MWTTDGNAPRDLASLLAKEALRIDEAIRTTAHQLYEQRGRRDGRALDDWLAAELQVLGTGRYRQENGGATEETRRRYV